MWIFKHKLKFIRIHITAFKVNKNEENNNQQNVSQCDIIPSIIDQTIEKDKQKLFPNIYKKKKYFPLSFGVQLKEREKWSENEENCSYFDFELISDQLSSICGNNAPSFNDIIIVIIIGWICRVHFDIFWFHVWKIYLWCHTHTQQIRTTIWH